MKILRRDERTRKKVASWINKKPEWHKWFAWFPVKESYNGDFFWLQFVERIRYDEYNVGRRNPRHFRSYVYKEITKEEKNGKTAKG